MRLVQLGTHAREHLSEERVLGQAEIGRELSGQKAELLRRISVELCDRQHVRGGEITARSDPSGPPLRRDVLHDMVIFFSNMGKSLSCMRFSDSNFCM